MSPATVAVRRDHSGGLHKASERSSKGFHLYGNPTPMAVLAHPCVVSMHAVSAKIRQINLQYGNTLHAPSLYLRDEGPSPVP